MIKNLYDVAVKGVKVSKKDARKLSKLLESAERAEAELLISKNIGLSKNLKRLIRLKQKIAMLEDNARDLDNRERMRKRMKGDPSSEGFAGRHSGCLPACGKSGARMITLIRNECSRASPVILLVVERPIKNSK